MRAEGADVAQPRAVTRQRRIGFLRLECRVFEAIELQREEQQRRRNGVDPLLHRLEEAADLGIGEIAGMDQRSVADDAPALFLQPLVCLDGGAECGTGEIGEATLIALAKGFRVAREPGEIAPQRLAVASRVEVRQIPLRQLAQCCWPLACGWFRHCSRAHSAPSRSAASPSIWGSPQKSAKQTSRRVHAGGFPCSTGKCSGNRARDRSSAWICSAKSLIRPRISRNSLSGRTAEFKSANRGTKQAKQRNSRECPRRTRWRLPTLPIGTALVHAASADFWVGEEVRFI